ncbi:MAG: hypothetical protein HN565_04640 [Rhodospirillales bacterium]|jgi:hypothetical protein|nr:hypothetical protein [Rhodospirillales bacterium]MBT7644181.1 hypothetical protein [Rhodospirillales bacterium]MBT7898051.1 hypothetical protein [Rhodospirillales bacterium]
MTEHPDKTRRKRLAHGGLAQMMREDPRYFDSNAPEHSGMVNMVTRGYEMLAEEDDDTTSGSRLAGAYDRMITDKKTVDLQEGTWLEKSGRTMMLAALDDHGIDFPSGIKEEAMALRKLYPKRAPQQIAPDTLQAPTTLLPPGTILSESQKADMKGAENAPDRPLVEGDHWEKIIDGVLGREGLFNPDDPSMRGIKKSTLREYEKREGNTLTKDELDQRLRQVSAEEARRIYRKIFIKDVGLEQISDPELAKQVFDGAVNQGQDDGVMQLQAALNKVTGSKLNVDGSLGSRTRADIDEAIKSGKLTALRHQIVKERIVKINTLKFSEKQKESLRRRARNMGPSLNGK